MFDETKHEMITQSWDYRGVVHSWVTDEYTHSYDPNHTIYYDMTIGLYDTEYPEIPIENREVPIDWF